MESFFAPNFRVGLVMMACLPASTALFTSELLAKKAVPVPFDGSTVVEGTDCPTTTSSLDADVCGILVAGLEKAKTQIKICKSTMKSTRLQITSHQPVASSLGGAATLLRH